MEERRNVENVHKVMMTGREKLSVSGVEDVDSFDEDRITVYTVDGTMTVKGAAFRINRLNVEDGQLEIEGEIDSIEYSDSHKKEKVSLFGKIFK